MALEVFETNKKYHQSRIELSSALYENDAAKRVIARLLEERNDAREKLNSITARQGMASNDSTIINSTGKVDKVGEDMEVDQVNTTLVDAFVEIQTTGNVYELIYD